MTFIVSFTVLIIDIHDQPASFMNTRNISNNFFFSPCCSKSGLLQFNRFEPDLSFLVFFRALTLLHASMVVPSTLSILCVRYVETNC